MEWLREPDADAVATPPILMAFELLYRDGRELVFPGRRLAPDGLEACQQVVERGYEWLVAKDEASVYEGGPTKRWLKVKVPGRTDAEERWRRLKTAPSHGPV